MGEPLLLSRFQGWHGPGYESNDNADAGVRCRGRPHPLGGEIVMLERGPYRGRAGLIGSGTPDVHGFWTVQVFCGQSGIYQGARPDDYRVIGHALRTPTGRLRRTRAHVLVWQPVDGRGPMAGLKAL